MANVLIVEDDAPVRKTYQRWLSRGHEVTAVGDGEAAFEALDTETDVVLLDRRMPGVDGDEVARRIGERTCDCRVAMVTAVEPSADVVALPFDEYVVKPVGRSELAAVVQDLLERQRYSERLQEYYALTSKLATLRTTTPEELRRAPEFDALADDLAALRTELDEASTTFSDSDYRAVLQALAEEADEE
jgi:DNA-binding response OmpR family regulator